MSKRGKIKNAAMRAACLFLAVFSVINFSRTAVFADCPDGVPDTDPPSCISSDDLVDINSKTGHDPMYDKHATACGVSGAVSTNPATNTTPVEVGGGSTLNLTPAQVTNIKTVIAVSKALGITRRGAEIGLMTARQESHYKDLKNTGISQDLQNAALAANGLTDQGTGGDHDSLGIMQQRISTGWSTYSNSNSDPKAIQQVLNPAYAAEAFFGIPKGVDIQYPTPTTNPGAVTKGLQNKVPDYDTTNSLTLAAQKVQGSAYPNAYAQWENEALGLLNTFYDSTPAATHLPVAFTGVAQTPTSSGTAGGFSCTNVGLATGSCTSNSQTQGAFFKTICAYAWPTYHSPNYLIKTPAYEAAVIAAEHRSGDYVGGGQYPGVDCGGFVTRVFRDSGADPHYNSAASDVRAQYAYVTSHPDKYQVIHPSSANELKPGDIYFEGGLGHTYIFVGTNLFPAHYDSQNKPLPPYNAASASFSTKNTSWRAPMASYVSKDFGSAHWVRPLYNINAGQELQL